ncbi:MarR family winged helix-turn-helix transcriptional regulator [Streptomyces sp. BE303]|uniref:MarR family winged helix-turn-helix transcriptional regulator n=1 Tax=Streptomycetaceae TaxID=2062 RepID=UPI002E7A027C|nr:MarR family winged helix-turn-helix transcriptional regulator [Streptomyces sp. BE303]MED7950784.1 MarR family winged helix-turn-helix transcriptional regulator [Streptomyces sp. BE303]
MGERAEWLDEREDEVWNGFFETQVLFWRRLAQQLQQETGLSEPDLAILQALLAAPDGRLRQYRLGGVTQFEKSRLHHHLNRMAGRDLVARESCPDGERGAVIALTEHGRAAVTAALPRRAAHIRRWLTDPLTGRQQEALVGISAVLLARLKGENPAG